MAPEDYNAIMIKEKQNNSSFKLYRDHISCFTNSKEETISMQKKLNTPGHCSPEL